MGITKVLSTDSVRHMLRTFVSKKDCPVLYASTYHAGECLDMTDPRIKSMTAEERVIEGYRQQCKLVMDQVEKIVEHCERNRDCLLIEGVHLLTDFVLELMKKHRYVCPYLVYISNDSKHKERFAVRAKYMTLDAKDNKYIKYFGNIRMIQSYLCERADLFNIPKIDNTNIDRSLATAHYSVFKSLKKILQSDEILKEKQQELPSASPLYDMEQNRVNMSFYTFEERLVASKNMINGIRKKRDEEQQLKDENSAKPKQSKLSASPNRRGSTFKEHLENHKANNAMSSLNNKVVTPVKNKEANVVVIPLSPPENSSDVESSDDTDQGIVKKKNHRAKPVNNRVAALSQSEFEVSDMDFMPSS